MDNVVSSGSRNTEIRLRFSKGLDMEVVIMKMEAKSCGVTVSG